VLSLANTAAQLDEFAAAVVAPCARAKVASAKMHQPPHITAMYVFDAVRIGVLKNQKQRNSTSVPCTQKASFLHLRLDVPGLLSALCRGAWRNPSLL
jgi:hypothetical protein